MATAKALLFHADPTLDQFHTHSPALATALHCVCRGASANDRLSVALTRSPLPCEGLVNRVLLVTEALFRGFPGETFVRQLLRVLGCEAGTVVFVDTNTPQSQDGADLNHAHYRAAMLHGRLGFSAVGESGFAFYDCALEPRL